MSVSLHGLTTRGRAMSHASIRKRLLRSNSEDKKQFAKNSTTESFRPKLERLLLENKIQYIMNTDPHTKADLFYKTHINQMEKQLSSAKKSLSTMILKTKAKQFSINKLKNDIANIEKNQAALRADSNFNKNKLQDIKQRFQHKKDDLEDKMWVDKSYDHMRVRLVYDQQFLRTRHVTIDRIVHELRSQKKILENNLYELNQIQMKLQSNLNDAKKISKQQTEQKNEFINLLNQEMAEKDMLNDLKVEKINREGQIADLMPSVIEKQQLQKYMKIFFTHKLLGQIIKKKSQKLIDRYSEVQKAYHLIKSQTNILQLSKVLSRMQKQDEEYEGLLKKVDSLEKQMEKIELQIDNTIKRQHDILSKDSKGDVVKNEIKYQGIQKDAYDNLMREKEKLQSRKQQDDILKKKIQIWVNEHLSLFEISTVIKNEDDFFLNLKLLQGSLKKKFGG